MEENLYLKQNITMVVPTIPKDVHKFLANIDVYFELLPISSICVVGNEELHSMLPSDDRIKYVSEDSLVDFNKIKNLIIRRSNNDSAGKRTGWYIQQFIKLGYSKICKDNYYLLWDSDTVPVKKVELFDDGIPYLDCKTEYHKPYFDTIRQLFPGYEKQVEGSFIAEHMLINKQFMLDMINSIEQNKSLEGEDYTEKIINAINPIELDSSGFSEFETYGTYVCKKYPNNYKIREWKSLRFGGFYFGGAKSLNDEERKWIAKRYDAISFEKGDYTSFLKVFVPALKHFCSPKILDYLSIPIRGFRKMIGKR